MVKFEGVRGLSYQGDIAIDAISFKPGRCSSKTPKPTTATTKKPATSLAETVQCNFDNGTMCLFINAKNDEFDWTLQNGKTASDNTGPLADVSGYGYYIYSEASNPRKKGDKANLVSPKLKSGQWCLTFSYHMFGSDIGKLNVHNDNMGDWQTIFTKSGNQGNQWKRAEIDVNLLNSSSIIFSTTRGNGWQGDIALDEISLIYIKCPTTPTLPPGSCGQKGPGLSDIAKIVGGQNARPGEWPWQVALVKKNFLTCCGALVSNQYIITAAHCVKASDWSRVKVRLGEHNTYFRERHEHDMDIMTNGITIHPQYSKTTLDYDIAIIKLKKSVSFTTKIKPVCLNTGIDFTGQRCYITGWGKLRSGGSTPKILQEAQVPIVTIEECKRIYKSKITDRMLCAGLANGGVDTCAGDSGGPLVCEHRDGSWYLTGITSWGRGCAKYYGVYTHVANLYSWITQITGL
ncbi:transmembrane protease serine 9-like [Xenia sp. Carnegie-2017]|uniref:transmembrane protease serine 9-like n=1 Tax=Xenia sp. Carnegie-2017 TaxID=2897299 RepID=UPI001F04E5BF|nr:transmembrane protease serine 9-like [Xenia sp. Carnegie-2017]